MPGSRKREAEVAVVRTAQPRSTAAAVSGATERRLAGAMEVPIEQVAPDPAQPRRDWDHDDGRQRLQELADSIREFGLLQPLLVREEGTLPDGRQGYRIIAGARRRAAAERAGLTMLPVVVRGAEQARIRVLQLIENLQRQNLSWLDEARAYQELIDTEALTPPTLAARLHISAQHVRDRLRVLADQVLADAVERRQISATAARDIKQLPDEEVMAFRTRVLAGERLQTNDIAAARARLAAAGVINPRRKGSRDTERIATPAGAPAPDPRGGESDPGPKLSVESVTGRPEATLGDHKPAPREERPLKAADGTKGEDTLAEAMSGKEGKQTTFVPPPLFSPQEAMAALAEIGQLAAGLSGAERRRIIRLLELAARLGWTIEELARRL
ncbi:MAG TPA: ParB/RepB/Spo0J family partition protein [Chloroflexota bacterium]|nr:ParB/RepB/Spo0J family partition protein [Chloroflexota bacterium]